MTLTCTSPVTWRRPPTPTWPRSPVCTSGPTPETAAPDEFHLGFGAVAGDWSLSRDGDLIAAAANLFAGLHIAEASDKPRIAVAPIPAEGLGAAIADRLQRAAAPASDFSRSA